MKGIGNTPLIKLRRITSPEWAAVYVKCEGANLTGSMKDRMALSMIEGAERTGQLKAGSRVIEFTGGSTGSSLAMVCAAKGYQAHFVSSDAFAEEKLQTMRAFGASVELVPSDGGRITKLVFDRCAERIHKLKSEPDTFWTDQFNNVENRNGYHAMAHEIISELGNSIDEYLCCVGTGGSFSGAAEVLKEKCVGIRCISTEPDKLRALSRGDQSGSHVLEGMGTGSVPSIYRADLADEIMPIKDEDAIQTARLLATKEGILGGTTSGANVWAALQRAKALGAGKTIVTVICDTGLKYLKGPLYRP